VHWPVTTKKRRPLTSNGARKSHHQAGGKDFIFPYVFGVNHNVLKSSHTVISNARAIHQLACPSVKPLNDTSAGVRPDDHHPAYTNDQVLTD
jgi:glyceraldehyde 3-phosphate dehydrogenase